MFAPQVEIQTMPQTITIGQLQKLSGASTEKLSGAVPVQSDGRTDALRVPVRPASEAARGRFRDELTKAQLQRTADEQAALDREFGP